MGQIKKTFTHPFENHDQQMTKTTKIKRTRELEQEDDRFMREEIAEYSTTPASRVKLS